MKSLGLHLLVLASAVVVHAQGTVNFINIFPNFANPVVNAPVYSSDGVTLLSGPQFMAELLAGPSADSLAAIATTGFLQGAAGYYNGGLQSISTVVPSATAWVEVRVWNTASGVSFLQAQASGLPNSWWQSSVFTVQVGGGFQGLAPGILAGLGNSPVYLNSVPEPSAQSLVILSAGLVVSRKLLNNSMKTKRRCPSTLQVLMTLGGKVNAQSLSPAAFAYRVRSAKAVVRLVAWVKLGNANVQ